MTQMESRSIPLTMRGFPLTDRRRRHRKFEEIVPLDLFNGIEVGPAAVNAAVNGDQKGEYLILAVALLVLEIHGAPDLQSFTFASTHVGPKSRAGIAR
jgi:hypothetical protein